MTEAEVEQKRARRREAQRKFRAANPGYYREYHRRYRERNRERVREDGPRGAAAWTAANPERRRAINRRRVLKEYGLTVEAYDVLLVVQHGGCAICGATSGRKGRIPLYVDHDHRTGAVRGLLCRACNMMLGNATDSAERLRAAADYLDRCSGPAKEE